MVPLQGSLTKQTMPAAAERIARVDAALAPVWDRHGPPPLWKRPQTFATFVRIILEQQVSLSSARSTFERLVREAGGSVTATSLGRLGEDGLRKIGFSRQKARYAVALADDVGAGRFRIATLRRLDDDGVRAAITGRLGLGQWSASVYLMMAMLRSDVIPHGDLALIKGLSELDSGDYADVERLIERTELWRPHRSVGVRMVWQAYLHRRGQRFVAT